jgi:hypothetical protein
MCANLGKYARGRKHEPYTENPDSQRPKKTRQLESKVKSMLIILFHPKGIAAGRGGP